jgi:hypothetical protein
MFKRNNDWLKWTILSDQTIIYYMNQPGYNNNFGQPPRATTEGKKFINIT